MEVNSNYGPRVAEDSITVNLNGVELTATRVERRRRREDAYLFIGPVSTDQFTALFSAQPNVAQIYAALNPQQEDRTIETVFEQGEYGNFSSIAPMPEWMGASAHLKLIESEKSLPKLYIVNGDIGPRDQSGVLRINGIWFNTSLLEDGQGSSSFIRLFPEEFRAIRDYDGRSIDDEPIPLRIPALVEDMYSFMGYDYNQGQQWKNVLENIEYYRELIPPIYRKVQRHNNELEQCMSELEIIDEGGIPPSIARGSSTIEEIEEYCDKQQVWVDRLGRLLAVQTDLLNKLVAERDAWESGTPPEN